MRAKRPLGAYIAIGAGAGVGLGALLGNIGDRPPQRRTPICRTPDWTMTPTTGWPGGEWAEDTAAPAVGNAVDRSTVTVSPKWRPVVLEPTAKG